jgi:hypothetical protein
LNAQQARADGTDPLALDEGRDPRDHQRHADDVDRVVQLQAQRLADEERWRDDANEDGRHVLKGGHHRLPQSRTRLQREENLLPDLFLDVLLQDLFWELLLAWRHRCGGEL